MKGSKRSIPVSTKNESLEGFILKDKDYPPECFNPRKEIQEFFMLKGGEGKKSARSDGPAFRNGGKTRTCLGVVQKR